MSKNSTKEFKYIQLFLQNTCLKATVGDLEIHLVDLHNACSGPQSSQRQARAIFSQILLHLDKFLLGYAILKHGKYIQESSANWAWIRLKCISQSTSVTKQCGLFRKAICAPEGTPSLANNDYEENIATIETLVSGLEESLLKLSSVDILEEGG